MSKVSFDSWEEFVSAAKDYCGDKVGHELESEPRERELGVLLQSKEEADRLNDKLEREVERLNDELSVYRQKYYDQYSDEFKKQVQEFSVSMLKRLVRTKTDVFLELLVWLYPSFEHDKINKIKFVREVTKWGLKDSKEFVETGVLPPSGAFDNGLPQFDQGQD